MINNIYKYAINKILNHTLNFKTKIIICNLFYKLFSAFVLLEIFKILLTPGDTDLFAKTLAFIIPTIFFFLPEGKLINSLIKE